MFEAIDRFIDRLEGVDQPPLNEKDTISNLAQLLLSKHEAAAQRVAVASTLPGEAPARCCALLQAEMEHLGFSAAVGEEEADGTKDFYFYPCAGLPAQTRHLQALQRCGQTVLVEQRKRSSLPHVREAVDFLREQRTDLVGMILI